MHSDREAANETVALERLELLEARLARVEEKLQALAARGGVQSRERSAPAPVDSAPAKEAASRAEEDLEFALGQKWFARAGILVLAIGAAFTLSLPYADLPAGLPSGAGFAASAALFGISALWRKSFELVSAYLRGAAMALLYFSALRLCYFGDRHVLEAASVPGAAVLTAAAGLNVAWAARRGSPLLWGVVLVMGWATALAVGTPIFCLSAIAGSCALASFLAARRGWPGLKIFGIALGYAAFLTWALNDPVLGRPVEIVSTFRASTGFILAMGIVLALRPFRRDGSPEQGSDNISALLNCGLGYGLYLVQTLAWVDSRFFIAAHAAAFAVFLGLAVLFWAREQSRVATFLYAMTGYMALSVAIIRSAPAPDVFVWLSLQSVVVAATAVYFRSRFIVVANFLIFAGIVAGYLAIARTESGISLGFGLVALVTARLLNWQRDRLELKTELMRNAYLGSAFLVFPYALYHLVPAAYVALAWVGIALAYYGLNGIVRNRKYRWMGHGTLLLTALYLMVAGIGRLEPVHRNLSLLVLGVVLLVVSLVFTTLRVRQRSRQGPR